MSASESENTANTNGTSKGTGTVHSRDSVTRKAAVGTLVTVVLRLCSFVGTQWCYRRLDPTALGRANVRLELLLTSILFVSREGFRLALTRTVDVDVDVDVNLVGTQSESERHRSNSNQGVAWLTVPVSTLVSLAMLFWHLHSTQTAAAAPHDSGITSTSPTSTLDLDYRLAGVLYCLAAAMEGWAEPAVLYFLCSLAVAEKASAEGLAILVKTATTVVALHHLQRDWPVSSFGLAQVTYALTYTLFLYGRIWRHKSFWSFTTASMWHGPTIYMTLVFTVQGVVKFALTEGDRIVLTLLAGSYDQGVYAMGSAYGGLAARLILQPLEENARLLFSRLASSSHPSTLAASTETTTGNYQLQRRPLDPMLSITYTVLVKMVLYVGLVFSCLAVNYTQILLTVLAGSKWGHNVEAVAVLSAFCVYTAFLAWNGMTEAFCYGIASNVADVGRLGVAHTVTGVVFALAAPVAVARAGTVGLVTANCVQMFGRAVFSVHFAARYFGTHQSDSNSFSTVIILLLRQMFPVPIVLVAFAASYVTTRASALRMASQIMSTGSQVEPGSMAWNQYALEHVGVGVACGIGVLSLAVLFETEFRRHLQKLWHDKSA